MKVFISYSRLDSDLGKAVYNYLCDNHDVFIDTKKIAGGEEWNNVIENEISKCDRFVIILTLSSINRTEVKKEIDLAINKKKMIIPCIHSSIEIKKIPRELNKYHGIQFEEGPELGRKLLAMINVQKEENRNNNEEKNPVTNAYEEKQNLEKTTISSVQAYLKNARVFERLRQNQRALSNYDQALKLDPDNFEILFPKVLLLYRIGQFEESLQTIEKAIDLQPENPDIWYHKGIVLEKMDRYQEALDALETDLLIDNKDTKSWSAKANILVKLGRYEEAIETFDEIIKIDPDNNTDARRNKDETIKELKKQEFSLLIKELESKFLNKDYSNVIELCDNAIIENNQNNRIILYLYKGNSLYELKQYEEARECYDKVLEIDSQNTEALNNKRKISQEQMNKEVEVESLSKKEIREIKLIRTLKGHSKSVESIAITTDNTKIVSGSDDKTIKVWDIETGELLQTVEGHSNSVWSIAITTDNTKIVSGSTDDTIKVLDIETGELLQTLTDDTIKVWDIETGEFLQTLKGHSDSVTSIAITTDNTKIVSGSNDNTIKVWDIETGELLQTLKGHSRSVKSIAITTDNTKIVSGSWDNTIKVWDIETGELLQTLKGHSDSVTSIAITTDNTKIVSGSYDNTIKVWDIETGELLQTLEGHSDSVFSIAITTDNTKIVSGSGDKTIKVWDIETGELLQTLEGHSDSVRSIAITTDSTKIVSGSFDNTIKVWQIVS